MGGGGVRKQASHQHLSLGATTQQHTPPPTYMPGYSPFHCKPQILIYILVLGNMKNGDILICTHTLFSLGVAGAPDAYSTVSEDKIMCERCTRV